MPGEQLGVYVLRHMYASGMCTACWLYMKFWEGVLKLGGGDRNVSKIIFRAGRGDEGSLS